ncbi:hypothetical protein RhiJN_04135 [Ceratobasidium sp. AG-Ba]|nr:hypothetical protein RhiJN_04135 [Ceratobasidium sp. AG-Ba]
MESELRFRGPPSGMAGPPPMARSPPPGPPPDGLGTPDFLGQPGPPPGLPHSPAAGQEFDPTDPATSIYTNLGVWDYYTERQDKLNRVPMVKVYKRMTAGLSGAPYAWRLLKDVLELAPVLIVLYLGCMALSSVMPAVALYYSSRMFQVIKDAVETRSVDSDLLIQIAVARGVSAFVQRACTYGMQRLAPIIGLRVRAHFSEYILRAHARLDVPTFDDTGVRGLLETVASDRSGSWEALSESFSTVSAILELCTQGAVLWGIIRESSDSVLLVGLSLIGPFATWWSRPVHRAEGAWFAKVNNENYVRMQGLKRVVTERAHRKELITGNLQEYISNGSHFHPSKV